LAIPTGKTARDLSALTRWTLTAVLSIGLLGGWPGGCGAWAAMMAGLGLTFAAWLLWRIVRRDARVPGDGLYAILGAAAAGWGAHFLRGVLFSRTGRNQLYGALDATMLTATILGMLTILLCQDLLGPWRRRGAAISAISLAGILGGLTLLGWSSPPADADAVGLVVLACAGMWLAGAWTAPQAPESPPPPWQGELRTARLTVAAAATAGVVILAPRAAAAGAACGALCLAGAAICLPGRRALSAAVAAGLLAASVALVLATALEPAWPDSMPHTLLGRGEEGLMALPAGVHGLAAVAAMLGWLPTGLLTAAGGAYLWLHLRRAVRLGGRVRARALVWTWVCLAATAALLLPGGLWRAPALTVAALAWGMLGPMVLRPQARRSGAWLALPVAAVLLVLGLGRRAGLVHWTAAAMDFGPLSLHVAGGFFLTLMVAWLLSGRSVWALGWGIAAAVAAGLAGELAQWVLTPWRSAEWADFLAHLAGSAVAAAACLIARASSGCESPDVPAPGRDYTQPRNL
jgi:hypothetical protein